MNTVAMNTVKEFLHMLPVSKNMVIVFDKYPSVCLEYRNEMYCISITYMDSNVYKFSECGDMINTLLKYCDIKSKVITRVELNNFYSTALLYGEFYEYEKIFIRNTTVPRPLGNIIDWC